MKLVLNGINHHNCPVRTREKLSFPEAGIKHFYKKLHAVAPVSEAVILQTCNRTEVYTYAKKDFNVRRYLADLIADIHPNTKTLWQKHSKQTTGTDAVRHLFRLAAGLDSQMLGENQVLAQLKAAYTESCTLHMSKLVFHKLFHTAFRAGKAVRTQTNISGGAVSISLAAVELAKKKINLSKASAVVIGAGDNAALAAKYLKKSGIARLYIANRSKQKAAVLAAQLKAEPLPLRSLPQTLSGTDLLIASTASDEPILTYDLAKPYLSAANKPLLIIDIAVPRDIDPKIDRFKSVSLYNIDDLNEQIDRNCKKRKTEIPKAEKIIDDFTGRFAKWYDSLTLIPTIAKLTEHGSQLARAEAKRYAKLFGAKNEDQLRRFAESLVKKVLHDPVTFLKNADTEPDDEQIHAAELINKIFFSRETKRR